MSTAPSAVIRSSEALWIESESIRILMESRRGTTGIAILAMLLMAVVLRGTVSDMLVLGWLLVALLILAARTRLKKCFDREFSNAKHSKRVAFIAQNSYYWQAYALVWGVSGWLFFTTNPSEYQYTNRAILTVVAIVSIFNLSSHRQISSQFINILQGTQVAFALWHIGIVDHFSAEPLEYAHLLALLTFWIIFRVLINRFYDNFYKTHVLQYRNAKLIQTLSHQAEQLEQEKKDVLNANETIKRFYSSAAHDIRQPVYALNVYADLITDDPLQTTKLLPKIKASCKAINALFHSLFDFEKIHAGQINVSMQSVDLARVFDDVQKHYLPQAQAKNIELRVRPAKGFLETDLSLLKGILYHLVSNAIKYTNQGGVFVVMRKTSQAVSFEVWDTGIGIDPLQQAHVFNEFFKVKEQSSADEGFGLGLSVVKRLAAFVDGASVTLQSRVGRGSVFRFSVPLTAYSNAPAVPLRPVQSLPGR